MNTTTASAHISKMLDATKSAAQSCNAHKLGDVSYSRMIDGDQISISNPDTSIFFTREDGGNWIIVRASMFSWNLATQTLSERPATESEISSLLSRNVGNFKA